MDKEVTFECKNTECPEFHKPIQNCVWDHIMINEDGKCSLYLNRRS